MKHQRKQLLIDRPVQIGVVVRLMVQWVCLLAAITIALPLVRTMLLGDFSTPVATRLQDAVVEGIVLLVIFLLLLPYFVYDSFQLTNRFAGPMYRLHQTFRETAAGKSFRPIKFREGDYWQVVADDFNTMMARLEAERATAEPNAEEEPVLVESH